MFKYAILSATVNDSSVEYYTVSVTYKNDLEVNYHSKDKPEGMEKFLYKNEEIRSVFFDGDLLIETVNGNILLKDVFKIETKNGSQ